MEYTEVDIRLKKSDPYSDILVAKLSEIDFESYVEDLNGLKAYIQTDLFDKTAVNNIFDEIKKFTDFSFSISQIKQQNWNKEWESNYEPVYVNQQCVIRTDFHNSFPNMDYEIIINPKMSFGTGHHETTLLMMKQMFEIDLFEKSILDVGTGTGILSILASKLGALSVLGVDTDKWAYDNAMENVLLNKVSNIDFICGGIHNIKKRKFDVVLANINRNTLLENLNAYYFLMSDNSQLLLSGFLKDDVPLILNKSEQIGLQLVCSKNNNKWKMLHLKRV